MVHHGVTKQPNMSRSAPGTKRKKIWVDYLVEIRWIIMIFVVLPISAILHFASYISDLRAMSKPYKRRQWEHAENVRRVVDMLRERRPEDGLVCTARKPYMAMGMRNLDYKRARRFEVDLSAFTNVLELDRGRMVVRVEPLVTMGRLTRLTVPMNISIPVVSEFEDLTVGGLINGFGIEGSSHIHGLFSDTVLSLELVLADGRVVVATKDNEYSDLFHAIPWSQGTIALLVSAEIKLVHIKEYMKLTYKPVYCGIRNLAEAYANSVTSTPVPDFVETLIYSPTKGVVMTGSYASSEEARGRGRVVNRLGWWFKPWFYQHAESAIRRGEFVEYIPTREYYHRHTRSLFWEMKLILPCGDRWWFRWLMGWTMPPKVSLMKMTQGEAIRNYYHDMHVVQDMLVPLHKVADALEFLHEEMEVYPIWLCPHRIFKLSTKTMVHPEHGDLRQGDTPDAQMFTDIGLYYAPGPVLRGEEFDGAQAVHRLEQWLIQNHGFQAQYSVSELSEKDFWRMFDGELYKECRRKYGAAGVFMDLYYKCKKGKKSQHEVKEAEVVAAAAVSGEE